MKKVGTSVTTVVLAQLQYFELTLLLYYIVIAVILIEELFNHYRRVSSYIVNSIFRSGLGPFSTSLILLLQN